MSGSGGSAGADSGAGGLGGDSHVDPSTPECIACENGNVDCQPLVTACDQITDDAVSGPATGTPRSDLCYRVLHCVRNSNCGKTDPIECYCGAGVAVTTCLGTASGVCKSEIEAGLESTENTTILGQYLDSTLGGGISLARATCDQVNCNSTCFR